MSPQYATPDHSPGSGQSDLADTRYKAVQLLRSLGLTGTEAEVYFTALQICSSEPVSSYKLAQVMGRDPANVAKTLGALVRLQAMSVVQDKPRLYLPADPAAFTERVLSRVQNHGREAVELLQRFQAPEPDGVTLALAGADQIFAKARELLSGCRQQALVFGSKESLRELGAELEDLGENPGLTVRVLSPLAMVSDNVDIAVFSPLSDLDLLLEGEFLQMVIDNRAWLCATLNQGRERASEGWWSDHSPIATALAGSLTLAWHAGHSPQPAIASEPVATVPEDEPIATTPTVAEAPAIPEPPEEFTPEPAVHHPEPVPAPQVSPQAEATIDVEEKEEKEELAFEEGLTFLMRHEDRKDAITKEKGEQ